MNLQNIKDKNARQTEKKTRHTLPHPPVAPVESPWFEITPCQKCIYKQGVLCSVVEGNL
jgi:hypothetical protein